MKKRFLIIVLFLLTIPLFSCFKNESRIYIADDFYVVKSNDISPTLRKETIYNLVFCYDKNTQVFYEFEDKLYTLKEIYLNLWFDRDDLKKVLTKYKKIYPNSNSDDYEEIGDAIRLAIKEPVNTDFIQDEKLNRQVLTLDAIIDDVFINSKIYSPSDENHIHEMFYNSFFRKIIADVTFTTDTAYKANSKGELEPIRRYMSIRIEYRFNPVRDDDILEVVKKLSSLDFIYYLEHPVFSYKIFNERKKLVTEGNYE